MRGVKHVLAVAAIAAGVTAAELERSLEVVAPAHGQTEAPHL